MATFPRPTYSEVLARVQTDIDTRLDNTDPRLRRSTLNTMAYMVAGVAHGLYGYISYYANQLFPETAEGTYLENIGAYTGVVRKSPTFASGAVTITGDDGTVIPIGTLLNRSDLLQFTTTTSGTIASNTVTVSVRATDVGDKFNTATSSNLSFVSPIAGANSPAIVSTPITGGANAESDDEYRIRVLAYNPPQGGSVTDYKNWALSYPGVTRVWVYATDPSPGYVRLLFCMDNDFDDGIPDSSAITNLQAFLNDKKPAGTSLSVEAPAATSINFTIHLINTDTSDLRTAATNSLKDFLKRDIEPGGIVYHSRAIEAINLTDGIFAANISVPSGDTDLADDHIAKLGTITWI